ncbi:uncharacterized protein LOC106173303 [Lingula anatina]|uniref:Uncharacterized protein LOC106173303 n=1 Tax=Lingula anatina TaxID=7574 RepID=A0A1S3JHK8_LINAN|nr:uncharacterized protein LOC106173303 [Lingula anatina]|eukprot:XP_013409843.1 uncharacterized protein LOC106173303 [Lingula anatina]
METTEQVPSDSSGVKTENHSQDEKSVEEISGWLHKRSKLSRKWCKKWCLLYKTDLLYGDQPEDQNKIPRAKMKAVSLVGAEIAESDIDNKINGFSIKPKGKKRTFYFCADTAQEQINWMEAICLAKISNRTTDNSEACVIQ